MPFASLGCFAVALVWLVCYFAGPLLIAQRSVRIAPADILIVHAKIYTADEKKPWAQSLAIRKGKSSRLAPTNRSSASAASAQR